MSNIKSDLPGGFRDYLPEDSKKRDFLIGKIKKTFERFDFSLLETPAVESLETLTGGEGNINKQIFEVKQLSSDKESKMGLRFDLTVSLARVIANYNNEITLPAKFYRLGRVWRGEKSQAGRYREFLQCDADIIGSSSPESDAEMLSLAYEILISLGIEKFKIKVSSRDILNSFLNSIGIPEDKINNVLIAIDKLDKTSWEKVEEDLLKEDLAQDSIDKIKSFIDKGLEEGDELKLVLDLAEKLGVPREYLEVDFSVVRGLDYYTGTVFEVSLDEYSELGTVIAGGRYDNLIEKFTGSEIPAIGISVGFDRIFEALKSLELPSEYNERPSVLILNFEESCKDEYLEALKNLRKEEISSTLYLGQEDNLKGQLSYAVKEEIPVVLIMGEKEKEEGVFQVKDMENRTQEPVKIEEVVEKIKELLK